MARQSFTIRQGSALVLVLVGAVILLIIAAATARYSNWQTTDRARYEVYKDEFAAAEVALNKSYAHFQHLITYGTPNFAQQIEDMAPPTVAGVDFDNFNVDQLFAGMELVTEGDWAGLNLNRQRYRIDVTARRTEGTAARFDREGVSIAQNLEITFIPLYLFAIFYDPVMEIAPGPYMRVNGLVHANGDAYFQSGAGLDFMRNVTVAGSVFHGRHPAANEPGASAAVNFTNGNNLVNMLNGGTWLDSTVNNWTSRAMDRWNGHFKDESHGVNPLKLPIPAIKDPHTIIERANASDDYAMKKEKLEYKAGLKIVANSSGVIRGYDSAGNVVDLTYPDPAKPSLRKSIVTMNTFYDAREAKTVSSIDVNMARMIESNIIPPNGILYVTNENQGSNPGVVRLTDGATLPRSAITEGFSVASDDPVYIKGDYNKNNRSLSMVAADALYILSNAWNDANSTNYSKRVASATEVNTVCMHGIVPSSGGYYSGGVENNFRFLENWSNKDFTFNGSIVVMWNSQKALGRWGQSNVYSPPRRIWAWDEGLGGVNGPPGAPRVVEIAKTAWELVEAGEQHQQ